MLEMYSYLTEAIEPRFTLYRYIISRRYIISDYTIITTSAASTTGKNKINIVYFHLY